MRLILATVIFVTCLKEKYLQNKPTCWTSTHGDVSIIPPTLLIGSKIVTCRMTLCRGVRRSTCVFVCESKGLGLGAGGAVHPAAQ